MKWILKGLKFLFTIDSWDQIKNVLEMERDVIALYFGQSIYGAFYLLACFYLFYKRPELKKKLLAPILLLIGMFAIPKTSAFIVSYMFETGGVYWRYFWLLQVHVLIAAAVVEVLYLDKKRIKYVLPLILVVLAFSGNFVFNRYNFQKAENPYKIPDEIIEICQLIKEDAGEGYLSERLTVAPTQISGWMRMYDGDICLLYGRYASYEYTKNEDTEEIDAYLSNGTGSLSESLDKIEENKCSYLVIRNELKSEEEFNDREYYILGEVENYTVYKLD